MATLTKGSHTDEKTRAKLARTYASKYKKGVSIRAIAEGEGRSFGFVHSILKDSGTEFRSRGGIVGKKRVNKKAKKAEEPAVAEVIE